MKEEDIEKLKNELNRIKLCQKYLNRQKRRKILYESELANLRIKLESELKDVQTLEKVGIRSLFHKTIGEYNKKLEVEKQEYLHAVINYNKCEQLLSLVDYEIGVLKQTIAKEKLVKAKILDSIKTDSQNKLNLKKGLLETITNTERDLESQKVIKLEIEETVIIGDKLLHSLLEIESGLKSIKYWGQNSDTRLKDIDEIQILCYQTELLLSRFEEELNDVLNYLNIELEDPISRMIRFNDIYIENLVVDWIVNKKIIQALNFTISLSERIDRITLILEVELNKINTKISKLESDRNKLIDKI